MTGFRSARSIAFASLAVASLAFAFAGFLLPLVPSDPGNVNTDLLFMRIFATLWTVVVAIAIFLRHRRGLWLLAGAPFALIWLVLLQFVPSQ